MFAWVTVFIIVTLLAGLMGLTGGVHAATSVAEVLFFLLLLLSMVAVGNAIFRRRSGYEEVNPQAKNKA